MFQTSRAERRALDRENAKRPVVMQLVPKEEWPTGHPRTPDQLWRSRDYLAQVFFEDNDYVTRISVNRTSVGPGGRWKEDIPWEDLQRIKNELGFAECDCVEVYPRDGDVVNVANMRHLFVMRSPLTFAWRNS